MLQKKEGKYWIVKAGIEEHTNADQTPDVGICSTAGFRLTHSKK
jgi:hypothetical protein